MCKNRNTFKLLVGMYISITTVEDSLDSVVIKDLEPEITFDPAIPLLGIYPKEYKSFYYKDTCTFMFIAHYLQ